MVSTCSTGYPKGKKKKEKKKSIYLLFKFSQLGSSQHLLFGPSSKRLIYRLLWKPDVAMAAQLIIIIIFFWRKLLLLLSVGKGEQAIYAFHNQLKANFCLNFLLFAGIIEYFCLSFISNNLTYKLFEISQFLTFYLTLCK